MKGKNRKATYLALLSIIFFTFTTIYPITDHQRLIDSPWYHYFASLVSRDGRALWNLSPLSLLQIHPISFGSRGSIFFLSGLSQLTGSHIEPAIYMMNLGCATLLSLSSFLLGRKIFKNNLVGILTPFFLFSTGVATGFLKWTASPRGFALTLLPLVLLLLLSSYEYDNKQMIRKKMFFLFLITIFIAIAVHRLSYFFIPIALSYFPVIYIYGKVKKKGNVIFLPRAYSKKRMMSLVKFSVYTTLMFTLIFVSISYITMFFGRTFFLEHSAFLSGEHISIKIFNYIYLVARTVRLAAPFAAIGFFYMISQKKNSYQLFLIVGICSFIPFSIREEYIGILWVVFISFFAAYGFYILGVKLQKNKRFRFAKIVILTLLLLIPVIVPPFVTIVEPYKPVRERKLYVTETEVETAIYIKYNMGEKETFITDPYWPGRIFAGESGFDSMSLRGISIAVINNTIRENLEVKQTISIKDSESFIDLLEDFHDNKGAIYEIKHDPLFPQQGYYRERHRLWFWRFFMQEHYKTIVNAYNIRLIIIDKDFSEQHTVSQILDDIEYITYMNDRFVFYPVPMDGET